MASGVILAGIGLAAVGYAGKHLLRHVPAVSFKLTDAIKKMPNTKYYKGGFQEKMDRREASLILGVSPTASKDTVAKAHKRIMLLNHPDRGGSPYLATKINEAKDFMDQTKYKNFR